MSWYSFHSVKHTWKSHERRRITHLDTDPVFEVCLLPDFRLFSKCLRRKNSPEHRTSSGARALTYSEVVQGISAPLDNDFWYRYQKQDFVEATRIALEASLNEGPLVTRFTFIAVHYTFL